MYRCTKATPLSAWSLTTFKDKTVFLLFDNQLSLPNWLGHWKGIAEEAVIFLKVAMYFLIQSHPALLSQPAWSNLVRFMVALFGTFSRELTIFRLVAKVTDLSKNTKATNSFDKYHMWLENSEAAFDTAGLIVLYSTSCFINCKSLHGASVSNEHFIHDLTYNNEQNKQISLIPISSSFVRLNWSRKSQILKQYSTNDIQRA